ncbi:MAG: DUF1194 domain-containing protein [Alphaproteobacteria bacterium]|nr:DUF1194 domain-containing protein [Alphaproteobacteria bacterium]
MVALVRPLAAAIAVVALAGPARAQSPVPVDVALVLAVDASGSIDAAEFDLQKDGIAGAITDPLVLSAIVSGPFQRLAIAYVEWGGPAMAETVVGWHIVEDRPSAEMFAAAVRGAGRSLQSYNAIGDAIVHGAALIEHCPCEAFRAVIDVSGDNPDNRSVVPALVARELAAAAGITINALAILEGGPVGASGRPYLVENYEAEVIAGPGAFVIAAEDRADFATALRRKMILEIAGTMPGNMTAAAIGRSGQRLYEASLMPTTMRRRGITGRGRSLGCTVNGYAC